MQWKEFKIINRVFCTLLILIFSSITFQTNVFAGSKEKVAQDYRLKGYDAQQKGNLDEALSFYIKAASLGVEDPSIFNDIGVIYEQLGVLNKAENYYFQSLEKDGGFLPAYTNLGYLYKNMGEITRSAEFFRKRVELGDPQDSWTIQAKEELKQLEENMPELREWLLERQAQELDQELKEKAQKEFYENVSLSKKHFEKAKKYEKKEQFSRAIAEYDRALTFTPGNPKIVEARDKAKLEWTKQKVKEHADAGMKRLELGDTVSAEVEFNKILAIIPDEPIQYSK